MTTLVFFLLATFTAPSGDMIQGVYQVDSPLVCAKVVNQNRERVFHGDDGQDYYLTGAFCGAEEVTE